MTRTAILLATVLLSLTFGGILGRKYFTYVLFVGIEPVLYPCPYSDTPGIVHACTFQPHEPTPEIAAWWHGWPTQDDQRHSPPAQRKLLARHSLFRPPAVSATH